MFEFMTKMILFFLLEQNFFLSGKISFVEKPQDWN